MPPFSGARWYPNLFLRVQTCKCAIHIEICDLRRAIAHSKIPAPGCRGVQRRGRGETFTWGCRCRGGCDRACLCDGRLVSAGERQRQRLAEESRDGRVAARSVDGRFGETRVAVLLG